MPISPPTPFKRFLIEGAVIVSSILLAFAIDAWWDQAKVNRDVVEILRLIEAEATSNLINLRESISHHEEIISAIDAAQEENSSAKQHFSAVVDVEVFEPSSDALETLVSTGLLAEVDDIELRIALSAFKGLVEDLEERESAALRFRDAARRRIAALGEVIYEDKPIDSLIYIDIEFLNLLTMRKTEESYAVSSGKRLEAHLQAIVDRLDELSLL